MSQVIDQNLYNALLEALRNGKVPVLESWAKTRLVLRRQIITTLDLSGIVMVVLVAICTIQLFLPLDSVVKSLGAWILLAVAIIDVLLPSLRIDSLRKAIAGTTENLGSSQPAAVLVFSFGGDLANWVFFATIVRGYKSWYTTLIQRAYLTSPITTSLSGKQVAVVHIAFDYFEDPNTLTDAVAGRYVKEAGTALEATLPVIDPAELTAICLRQSRTPK